MEESIFNRIYKYRVSENKNERENYLIEIFAYCLQQYPSFLTSFHELIGLKNPELGEEKIRTQISYEEGRPDIEIMISDKIQILIECKIETTQRENQLEDYRKILKRINYPFKYLVYLTKYYESNIEFPDINFKMIRWQDIINKIPNDNTLEIIDQLKKYLKEQGMEKASNFNVNDLVAMKYITSTMSKMDEILDQIRNEIPSEFKMHIVESRSTQFKNNWYGDYVKSEYLYIEWGFYFKDEFELPRIFVDVFHSYKDQNNKITPIVKEFYKKLESKVAIFKWETEKGVKTNELLIGMKSMSDFIDKGQDDLFVIKKFIIELIKEVHSLLINYPKIFVK